MTYKKITYDELKKHVMAISDYCDHASCKVCPFDAPHSECQLLTNEVYEWRKIVENMETHEG